jgi:hypothetical protein
MCPWLTWRDGLEALPGRRDSLWAVNGFNEPGSDERRTLAGLAGECAGENLAESRKAAP